MFRTLLVICLIALGWAVPAQAQTDVTVRSGVHPSYNRLVFDWPKTPSYTVAQEGNRLTVTFEKPATADLSFVQQRGLPNIKKIELLSAAGQNLKIGVDIPVGSRFRHFSAGDRMVLDIYNPDGSKPAMTATHEVKEVKKVAVEQPPKEKTTPPKEPEPASVPADTEKSSTPEGTGDMPAQPVQAVETEKLPSGFDSHVITLTSTNAVGVAAFERSGWLWIVVDDPQLSIAPEVAGPQKDSFPEIKRFDLSGGIAFRMELPQGLKVHTEGGGLLWRIVLSPHDQDIKYAMPEREFDGTSDTRGGTILWPISGLRKVLELKDPEMEDTIEIVTVDQSDHAAGPARTFIDLRTLPSFAGIALIPQVDDLAVRMMPEGVAATRTGGLALSRDRDVKPVELRAEAEAKIDNDIYAVGDDPAEKQEVTPLTRIYNFDRWEMGGERALEDNQNVLMSALSYKEGAEEAEDLLTLAKLMLANNRAQEAAGYLRVAEQEMPDIAKGAEFLAMRGAAEAMSGRYDEAIEDLSDPVLKDFTELGYWKAYTLAGLEDWQQAYEVMPKTYDLLNSYPRQISEPLTLGLAEVALRAADLPTANTLLSTLEPHLENMSPPHHAAWSYLMGEAARQAGDADEAKHYWEPLVNGKDDYYRAKAGLSLTKLQIENNDITSEAAIDRLEGLRYAWRGDELETLINYRLGQMYIQNGDYLKGLSVLRNAAGLYPDSKMGREVTDYMTTTFRDIFMKDGVEKLAPLEAVSIYDEFKELTPAGAEGDAFVERLAEKLVEVDLLGRAADLLENQVAHRLEGAEKARVATRLAAIRLLDNKPDGALRALDVAEETVKAMGGDEKRMQEIHVLRARALYKLKKVDAAMAEIENIKNDPIAPRLRADVAWNAGRWDEAADALNDLILEEDISPSRPLTSYQTDLILNRAIALNLSNNRVALANLRERFGDAMKQTEKAQLFEVVTRPRQLGLLGNRESVSSLISEVDLFGDFLDTYRKTTGATQ